MLLGGRFCKFCCGLNYNNTIIYPKSCKFYKKKQAHWSRNIKRLKNEEKKNKKILLRNPLKKKAKKNDQQTVVL